MAERWRNPRYRPQDEREEQEGYFGAGPGYEDEWSSRRHGSFWREGQEGGRQGRGMDESYRRGQSDSDQRWGGSAYEDRGSPSGWTGGERSGRMGWPRFGQGDSGEGHEWGGRSRGWERYGQRGGPSGQWGGRGEMRGGMGYEGEGMPWESSRGGRPDDDMARRMGDWRQHQEGGSRYGSAQGPHRGRGPRGYARSDERIREDVNDCLCDDAFIDASDIDVQVSNGEVTLSGTVDSREAKRRAEDLIETISGVRECQNHLRIKREQEAGGGTMQQRAG